MSIYLFFIFNTLPDLFTIVRQDKKHKNYLYSILKKVYKKIEEAWSGHIDDSRLLKKALKFYGNNIGSVEIIWKNSIKE